MSERKTTEIKLRVTPAEKTAWQIAAEQEGIGLSELIRREMNSRAAQNGHGSSHPESDAPSSIAPTEDVPTSSDENRVGKPWMFEARTGG